MCADVGVSAKLRPRMKEIDHLGRSYATGRRKSAVARVFLRAGKGKFVINNKECSDFFKVPKLLAELQLPFQITGTVGRFDVFATAKGGGVSGQVGALRLGISRALVVHDGSHRAPLKKVSLLTRDPRVVERKKYGRKKARKSFQYSKR